MSRHSMLNTIERVERIADMLPGCSESELNSLGGQALGALSAVVNELKSQGMDTDNQMISRMADRLERSDDVYDAVFAFQAAAGFLRGLIEDVY